MRLAEPINPSIHLVNKLAAVSKKAQRLRVELKDAQNQAMSAAMPWAGGGERSSMRGMGYATFPIPLGRQDDPRSQQRR
jgi:hypothetical protein